MGGFGWDSHSKLHAMKDSAAAQAKGSVNDEETQALKQGAGAASRRPNMTPACAALSWPPSPPTYAF